MMTVNSVKRTLLPMAALLTVGLVSLSAADVSESATTWNGPTITFRPFRAAVDRPQNVVGKELVLHLIESDIYLQVRFTSWSQSKQGGFGYERSTP